MSPLSYTHLWPLWLLGALPLVWLAARRHGTSLSRGGMILATILRSAAIVVLAIALVRPVLHRGIHAISVVYALDISRSVSPEFIQASLNWIRAANLGGKPAHARYVAFADHAELLDSIDDIESLVVTQDSATEPGGSVIGQSETNLEQALELSLFGFAPNHAKRLVLMSDGNQTQGDIWRALSRLREQQVRLFTVPASVAVTRDAWIDALEAPESVRVQEPAALKVGVFARTRSSARVRLRLGDESLGAQTVTLSPGESELIFRTQFKQPGANTLEVHVAADGDQVAENDMLTQTVWVGAKPKVLYVESTPGSARYLRDALRKQAIDVSVAGVDALVANRARLDGQDAVILSDVPAEKLDRASARRLEAFVREGGGLIFAAGENTYGKQGFAKSKVERLLPVKFEGKRKRKELDLVLLLDRSFSMRGRKLEFAKSAALSTLDLLDEQHRLAVIAFDSQPHEVVPLFEVGNKRRAEDLISSISASGQTNLYNALWYALSLLQSSQAKTKHIILLSDGQTAPPGRLAAETAGSRAMEMLRKLREQKPVDEQPVEQSAGEQGGVHELTAQLAADKITLSTVAIGEQPNVELLASLAKGANGNSHVAENEAQIPSLFVAEAKRLLGESIVEEPFRPIVKIKTEAVAGVDFAKGPELKGFVLTRPKRLSEVLLQAKDGQPLLVQTHYGLGKSVAFLSDVKNRWAADWLNWPGYGKFWAQLVRESIRRDTNEELALRVAREGEEAVITLTALTPDGQYRNEISPRVRVTHPDANSFVTLLRQVGPGKYETRVRLQASGAGPTRFELIGTPGVMQQDAAKAGTRSVFYAYSDEYRVLPSDVELLNALSEQTGGKFAPKPEEVFANYGDRGVASNALWPYFAAAALLLFLLDIVVRRAPWFRGAKDVA